MGHTRTLTHTRRENLLKRVIFRFSACACVCVCVGVPKHISVRVRGHCDFNFFERTIKNYKVYK